MRLRLRVKGGVRSRRSDQTRPGRSHNSGKRLPLLVRSAHNTVPSSAPAGNLTLAVVRSHSTESHQSTQDFAVRARWNGMDMKVSDVASPSEHEGSLPAAFLGLVRRDKTTLYLVPVAADLRTSRFADHHEERQTEGAQLDRTEDDPNGDKSNMRSRGEESQVSRRERYESLVSSFGPQRHRRRLEMRRQVRAAQEQLLGEDRQQSIPAEDKTDRVIVSKPSPSGKARSQS
mmetsp:Transcript_12667/g.25715  ORF Transcript_12667/g.25715 Transcript_12667/m.25715 type:complete len:231 (+) Transcript_12667:223-915(+)